MLEFKISGPPFSKERPRLGRNGNVYTPESTHKYESHVGSECLVAMQKVKMKCLDVPVNLRILAVFYRKKNDLPHVSPKDVDNIEKAVLDGMNKIAFTDDKLVVSLAAAKRATDDPSQEGVYVWLKPETQENLNQFWGE